MPKKKGDSYGNCGLLLILCKRKKQVPWKDLFPARYTTLRTLISLGITFTPKPYQSWQHLVWVSWPRLGAFLPPILMVGFVALLFPFSSLFTSIRCKSPYALDSWSPNQSFVKRLMLFIFRCSVSRVFACILYLDYKILLTLHKIKKLLFLLTQCILTLQIVITMIRERQETFFLSNWGSTFCALFAIWVESNSNLE